jgi:very-short-patch-repair endonuclease
MRRSYNTESVPVHIYDDAQHRYGLEHDEARRLRRSQTDPEHALWTELRAHKFPGLKFRRQHPIGPYIVDFCCIDRKLIVELDSSQHLESTEYDSQRTAFLSRQGYRVVRFWNHEVLTGIEDVLERLKRILSGTIA